MVGHGRMRQCYGCDEPVLRGDVRQFVDGEPVHDHCRVDVRVESVCRNQGCFEANLVHAGACT